MSKKIVTYGEVMLRLATNRRERFTQAREFEATYGGGECNVAVSLAHFGEDVSYSRYSHALDFEGCTGFRLRGNRAEIVRDHQIPNMIAKVDGQANQRR